MGVTLRGPFEQDGETWLEAVQADPHVLIAPEMLESILGGLHRPGITCYTDSHQDTLIKIRTRNRGLLVYRIGEYVPEKRCWSAHWPD